MGTIYHPPLKNKISLLEISSSGSGEPIGLSDPGSNGYLVRTSAGSTIARLLVQPLAGLIISNSSGVSGNSVFSLANDLLGLEGLSSTGYAKRTGTDTWTTISSIPAADLPGSFSGFSNPTTSVGLSTINGTATTAMR